MNQNRSCWQRINGKTKGGKPGGDLLKLMGTTEQEVLEIKITLPGRRNLSEGADSRRLREQYLIRGWAPRISKTDDWINGDGQNVEGVEFTVNLKMALSLDVHSNQLQARQPDYVGHLFILRRRRRRHMIQLRQRTASKSKLCEYQFDQINDFANSAMKSILVQAIM
jgi:hypothetical protein